MFTANQKKWFVGLVFALLVLGAIGSTAVSPLQTGTVISYNHQTIDKNVLIYRPDTIQDVQELIRDAHTAGKNVRFSGASHSTSSLILGSGIYIKSEKFNHIDGIEIHPVHGPVVQVESGVKLGDLADYLGQHGYTMGFSYPSYFGVTMGGLTSTGSHGSSRRHVGISSQNIVEMTIVNSRGELIKIDEQTPDVLKAARVSLGLLGFVYKLKLKIVPNFKLEMTSEVLTGDKALLAKDGQVNWGPAADIEYIYWFPAQDRAVKVSGVKTDKPASPGAQSIFLGQSADSGLGDRISYQILAWGKNNTAVNKMIEDFRFKDIAKNSPPYVYLSKGKEVQAQGVVGWSANMLISKRIPQNPAFTAHDISFSFRVEDAPKVMGIIHQFCKDNHFYHPFAGIFLRFARSSGQSYLSHIERQDGRPTGLYVMAEFFEPKKYEDGEVPSISSKLREKLLNQLIAEKLVTFHWGKNIDKLFGTKANKNALGDNVTEFERIRRQMDPDDTFKNSFASQYLLN